MADHLRAIDSYWFHAIPIEEKVQRFVALYLRGLSLPYWFFPDPDELVRHRWLGLGNIRAEVLPLFLVGVALALWRFRDPRYRAVVLALLVAPLGAALVGLGITRVLAFVIPASILACLGLDFVVGRVSRRVPASALAAVVCLVLSATALAMLRQALVEAPLWFRNYGLFGMQWGARQLFGEAIPAYLLRHPDARLLVTPTWANDTNLLASFFLAPSLQGRVEILNVDAFLEDKREIGTNTVFVLTEEERERAEASGKFRPIEVESVLSYPDGSPGFYFARLAYVQNIDEIFAGEIAARRRLVEEQVRLGDQAVLVRHSRLDGGRLSDIFDGDRFTLGRVQEANPAIFELAFTRPRPVTGLSADFGSMDFELTVELYETRDGSPVTYTERYEGLPPDPHVEMSFDQPPPQVEMVRLEVRDLGAGDTAKIHVRELALHP